MQTWETKCISKITQLSSNLVLFYLHHTVLNTAAGHFPVFFTPCHTQKLIFVQDSGANGQGCSWPATSLSGCHLPQGLRGHTKTMWVHISTCLKKTVYSFIGDNWWSWTFQNLGKILRQKFPGIIPDILVKLLSVASKSKLSSTMNRKFRDQSTLTLVNSVAPILFLHNAMLSVSALPSSSFSLIANMVALELPLWHKGISSILGALGFRFDPWPGRGGWGSCVAAAVAQIWSLPNKTGFLPVRKKSR